MTRRNHRRSIRVGLLVLMLVGISVTAASQAANAKVHDNGVLVVAGYGGVTAPLQDKYFFQPFEQATGIHVQVQIVPGQQVAGIAAQNAAHHIQWDLTIGLADTDMATMLHNHELAQVPKSLQTYVKKYIPGVRPWGIPSKRGAVMIACNYALVKRCPKTPKQFFDTKDFPGPRALPSFQPLVAIALALEADGVKPKDIFPTDLKKAQANVERAIKTLDGIKSSMKVFYSSSTTALQLLNAGEVTMGGLWNTINQSAYLHPSANLRIGATWNGAVTYSQWDVVYKGAPDEANAWKFLDWLYHHPENVAEYSQAAPSGTSDSRAFLKLTPTVRQWLPGKIKGRPATVDTNPVWYIRSPKIQKMIDDFWTNFTNG